MERTIELIFLHTAETPIGTISLMETDSAITGLYFAKPAFAEEYTTQETPLLKEAARQLQAYFARKLTRFDLPLAPKGTPFQLRVWGALQTIPYGELRSYKDIAVQIGNPKGCRAVGGANNRNPISIFIPCHRVIGADKSLVGYGGGLEIKQILLGLEQQN